MFGGLYNNPLPSTRGDPIFNIHSYPTKIDPVAVLGCILAHTSPGETVFDGFSGSGTTAIASLLAKEPGHQRLLKLEKSLDKFELGVRKCHAYDVSGLGWFIGNTIINRPNVEKFKKAAERVLENFAKTSGGLYSTVHEGTQSKIRHVVWSALIECPHCKVEIVLGERMVDLDEIVMKKSENCLLCKGNVIFADAKRITEVEVDAFTGVSRVKRKIIPWLTYGKTDNKNWRRKSISEDIGPVSYDFEGLEIPIRKMQDSEDEKWGELHRSGYHQGITHLHHFYTNRNLWVIAKINSLIGKEEKEIQPALKLWLSSYISTHATLMTRVVCKKGSKDLTTTSKETATMYVSNLPVEKNIIAGLKYKLKSFVKGFLKKPEVAWRPTGVLLVI